MEGRLRILVVDDDEALRRAVVRVLRQYTFVVDVDGARAALRELERAPYDVIISDFDMPTMTGGQLLEEVRQRWPAVRRILTSGDEVGAVAAVADRFLIKSDLPHAIRAVLRSLFGPPRSP